MTFENLRIDGKLIAGAQDGNFEIDPRTTDNTRFIVTGGGKARDSAEAKGRP